MGLVEYILLDYPEIKAEIFFETSVLIRQVGGVRYHKADIFVSGVLCLIYR
jgi:hypothetical protein